MAGRYFLQRLIGSGGVGDVYEATWLSVDRRVALKLIRASSWGDEESLRRLELETAAAARLSHTGCVEVVDHGRSSDGELFIAMELLSGRDLARLLAEEGPLSSSRAAHLVDQLLEVLETAHGLGVLHRDVKPANVMVTADDGGAERVRVLDFGNAWIDEGQAQRRLTQEGVVRGTPAYMSPEQLRGEPLDARCDLYAVGLLLHELLAGVPPFQAGTAVATAALQLRQAPPPLRALCPQVPAALEALVLGALSKDRSGRPPSASAMRRALAAAVSAEAKVEPAVPRPVPPTELFSVVPAAQHRPVGRAAALAVGLAIAGVALAVLGVRSRPDLLEAHRAMGQASGPAAGTTAPVTSELVRSRAAEGPWAAAESGSALAPTRLEKAKSVIDVAAPRALSSAAEGSGRAAGPRSTFAPTRPAGARSTDAAVRVGGTSAPGISSPPPRSPIRTVRGELNSVPTPPPGSGEGVLVLEAIPWAEVSIDGHALGETPRELRIVAGSYRVLAAHPELGAEEETVSVHAGERKVWTARLPFDQHVR